MVRTKRRGEEVVVVGSTVSMIVAGVSSECISAITLLCIL